MWAAKKSNLETLEELVAHGANVSKTTKDGSTLLHMAASNNDIHMLDFVLGVKESRVDIEAKDEDGWTAAGMAGCLNNFDSLNLLLENGASIETKNTKTNLSVYESIVQNDNADLLECIYSDVKKI